VATPLLYAERHVQPVVVPANLFAPYIPGGCIGV